MRTSIALEYEGKRSGGLELFAMRERERVREKKLKILFHYNNKKFENGNLKSNIHLFKSFMQEV